MSEGVSSRPLGTLKIYLGYAAGVGKTFKMLEEGHKLKREGQDVVIGYFEPHGRKDTIAEAEGIEMIARRKIQYRGAVFEEMDTAAILQRSPQVCLVDEFAHSNVPGSERSKRWEDVQILLDAGIGVLTTMNVQHIESLNDQVWHISGIRVRETVPDWVVKQADEIVMVDVPPQALLNRLRRGAIYAREKANLALQNFFKESTLVALRELALRQTAHEVDVRHVEHESGAATLSGGFAVPGVAHSAASDTPQDRILIHVTPDPLSAMLIRRGRRVADYQQADCFAVAVERGADGRFLPAAEREALDKHLNFARNLHIETRVLEGENVAETLVDFAHRYQVTQIFLARPHGKPRLRLLHKDLVREVVRKARNIEVTVVAERHR
ncbi:MAG TPA: histidine kinase [Terriglobia bacterium]|nr:histidine kinase [Terriglobia bacterium]